MIRGILLNLICLCLLSACGDLPSSNLRDTTNPFLSTTGDPVEVGHAQPVDEEYTDQTQPALCAVDSYDIAHERPVHRTLYQYDTHSRLITIETTRISDRHTWASQNTVYRADGRASQTWEFGDSGDLLGRQDRTYTPHGLLKTKRTFSAENTLISEHTNAYNGDNQRIESSIYHARIDEFSVKSFYYDELGRLQRIQSQGFPEALSITYSYSDDGHLETIETESETSHSYEEFRYSFGRDGLVLESQTLRNGEIINRTTYKYRGTTLAATELYQGASQLLSRSYYYCESLPSL